MELNLQTPVQNIIVMRNACNIEKYKYQQRLVTFLLAMKKIFMSMPENNIIEWNETLTKIENKCSEHNFIKLSRLGVIENNLSYFKITK